jgi:actin-related protein 3
MAGNPAVVIDNGTGYTKMGFAGNSEPQYIIPTAVAIPSKDNGKGDFADLDYHIGDAAYHPSIHNTHRTVQPIAEGQIANWDLMEKLWHQSYYKYLRCDPELHYTVLTEPPMNDPKNKDYMAEVMFETFNVPGLQIAVQAVLALIASWESKKAAGRNPMTGLVVDSGDGVTHIIPVVDGFVIGSCIKHIPIAGRDMTKFVFEMHKDRENIPRSEGMRIARETKENHCYVCKDMLKEFRKYDQMPDGNILNLDDVLVEGSRETPFEYQVGYERFLAAEIFFNPAIYTSQAPLPLPELIDQVVMSCPMDCRLDLLKSIVLSGGSTLYKDFAKRVQMDVKKIVDRRLQASNANASAEVTVLNHSMQRFAVWYGGSTMASMSTFEQNVVMRAQFDEVGPSVMRRMGCIATD